MKLHPGRPMLLEMVNSWSEQVYYFSL